MFEPSQSDLGMTRNFRRKLVLVGFVAYLMTFTGLFSPNLHSVFLLVPASAGGICWLFLLGYALYDVGLFKRYPDERQREVRNRVYSTSYRLMGVLMSALLVFVLSGTNRTFDVGVVTPDNNIALFVAALLESLLIVQVALAAWLEPDPVVDA